MGEVDVEVFEGGVEAVLAIVDEELVAEVALVGGVAVVGAVEGGEVEAPVDVVALDGVGEALDVEDGLVEFEAVGVEVVAFGRVAAAGGAAVYGGVEPAVDLGS